jgi:hypothetical protein
MKSKMKCGFLFLAALLLASMAVAAPAMADEGRGNAAPPQETGASIATGQVTVSVLPWLPDLSATGSGLFTSTEFDVSGFFSELCESLSELLGAM